MDRASGVATIVVMGVSGSGKTTVAVALSKALDAEYLDADWLHPTSNVFKMSHGVALDDDDRLPWLTAVGRSIQVADSRGRSSVTACSALKRSYRDILRFFVADIFFVYLHGTIEQIGTRLEARRHGFLPISLLPSQFAILEPLQADERGVALDVSLTPDDIVGRVLEQIGR